ncbi:hypothetical protein GCM10027075_74380 [Streptomyces heilongjiangensis]
MPTWGRPAASRRYIDGRTASATRALVGSASAWNVLNVSGKASTAQRWRVTGVAGMVWRVAGVGYRSGTRRRTGR